MTQKNEQEVDVVVIGAGPAGYPCAIRLAQLGRKVTVIEKTFIGGVCLNVGCIPSKALIHAGSTFEKVSHAADYGIDLSGTPKVNLSKMMDWKSSVVKKLTGGVTQLLKANGCQVIRGEARFTGPYTLKVATEEREKILRFKNCVVATGSRPTQIPGFTVDQKDIWDSTGALDQQQLPKSLLCIGGGYIGLELGTFYAKVGTKVTVVEAAPQLLGVIDPELTRVVEKKLDKLGVEVLRGVKVEGQTKKGNQLEVSFSDGKKRSFDKILVTVGRRPNTDQLDLDQAGIRLDDHGFIRVNARRQSDISHIYAVGDVAGQPLLAHKGTREGIVAAEVIGGLNAAYDVVAVPAVVFTDPEIATVGLTEKEAKDKGLDVRVGKFPFVANGRALSVAESDGFVKMVAEKETGKLLGVHIVGVEASNLIAEATLALEMGATLEDLATTIHAHPTLPEVLMEAAETTLGHPIHIFERKASAPARSPEASV